MPKNGYVGINSKARKIKNMYVGVDGKARKIKKAYIGVDNKARIFFDSSFTTTLSKWNKSNLPTRGAWSVVAYGGGKFVAAQYYSGESAYSLDGVNWYSSNILHSQCEGIAYGNGKFVAIYYGVKQISYSTDGINWYETDFDFDSSSSWADITYGNGKFVAIMSRKYSAYSNDGVNWTFVSIPSVSVNINSIVYGDGKFIAVGNYGDKILYSLDGVNWSTSSIITFDCREVAYGNGVFVTVGNNTINNRTAAHSYDGIKWYETYIRSGGSYIYPYSISFGDGIFVATSINGDYCYSSDGVNWVVDKYDFTPRDITYGNGKFVTVGSFSADENDGNKSAYALIQS